MTVPLGLKLSGYTTQNELILMFTSPPGFASRVPELDQEPDYETGLSVLLHRSKQYYHQRSRAEIVFILMIPKYKSVCDCLFF